MEVTDFGRNIKALREREGITQAELADSVGISEVMVSGYESRGQQPRRSTIQLIADKYGVSERDLTSYADGLYAQIHGIKPIGYKCFAPLLGRVHAGSFEDGDILDGEIPIPASVLANHPKGYYLEVEGDCMSRIYPDGCYIFVDPSRRPQNGDIAVLHIDGMEDEYIMRRIHYGTNTLMLSPDSYNGEWDDIFISDESTVIYAGTVVWFQAKEELCDTK